MVEMAVLLDHHFPELLVQCIVRKSCGEFSGHGSVHGPAMAAGGREEARAAHRSEGGADSSLATKEK